jgi:hypothetical protein
LEERIDQLLFRDYSGLGCLHILCPKDLAHRFDRKEILPFPFGSLPLSRFAQSPSRNDAVKMGM